MQRGSRPSSRSIWLALGVSVGVAACGHTDGDAPAPGSAGGGSECHDYVTEDGFTCCCGVAFCTRNPGCNHDGIVTMPPLSPGMVAGGTGGRTGAGGAPTESFPAPHADFPRVVFSGGPVLRAPRVVPIFFQGDGLKPELERLMAALPGSYWTATTSEYGVGALTVAPSVVVSDSAPPAIEDPDVASWLADLIVRRAPGMPAPTDGDVYTVFFPETTTITLFGEGSCSAFGGYHNEGVRHRSSPAAGSQDAGNADAGATGDSGIGRNDAGRGIDAQARAEGGGIGSADVPFAYAVIARCPPIRGSSELDDVTVAVSHELIEASTDPFPQTNPAYSHVDASHAAWLFGVTADPLGELSDLCIYDGDDGVLDQFFVTRSWSNRAAATGLDPCVPSSSAYYAAAPDARDTVTVKGIPATGVRIPVGGTKTVDVRLFSSGPTNGWSVSAIEGPLAAAADTLDLAWDKQSGKNGDVLKLTITRRSLGPLDGTSVVIVYSSLQGFGSGFLSGHAWPMLVGE